MSQSYSAHYYVNVNYRWRYWSKIILWYRFDILLSTTEKDSLSVIATCLLKTVIYGDIFMRSWAVSHDRNEPTNQLKSYLNETSAISKILFITFSTNQTIKLIFKHNQEFEIWIAPSFCNISELVKITNKRLWSE